ncbi:MAG: hypothetical protein ACI4ST_05705 [Candidatus Gallimonas sp.]
MRFRNAVHITIDNFSFVFKSLLYRIVIGIIFFSLSYVVLSAGLSTVVQSAEMAEIKDLVVEFFRALFTGNPERLQTFQGEFTDSLKALVALMGDNLGSIVGSLVGVCVIYLLARFANGLSIFAVAGAMNDRMSAFSRTSFSASYFRNAGRGVLYQLIYVPLAFVYDLFTALACWFFFFYVLSHILPWGVFTVIIALALTVTAVVCLESLKMTLISAWIPAIVAGEKKVGSAMKESFCAKKKFASRLGGFAVAVYLIIIVNVAGALCTLGSALLLTLPLSFVFLLALQFVNYYEDHGKKYFISLEKIAGGEGVETREE